MSDIQRGAAIERLRGIEQAHDVTILLAVESGSRAWGFPSRDSDLDVRFVYAHPVGRYLSVAPPRDTIEVPFDPPYDLGGWDLRKAVGLLCRSNPTLNEWATSPVRYVQVGDLAARLVALGEAVVDRAAVRYHYDRMARRAWDAVGMDEAVPLKRYCYALRASLAKLWVDERGTLPPMDLASLLRGVAPDESVSSAAEALVAAKCHGDEGASGPRLPELDRLIDGQLRSRAERPSFAAPSADAVRRADALVGSFLPGP